MGRLPTVYSEPPLIFCIFPGLQTCFVSLELFWIVPEHETIEKNESLQVPVNDTGTLCGRFCLFDISSEELLAAAFDKPDVWLPNFLEWTYFMRVVRPSNCVRKFVFGSFFDCIQHAPNMYGSLLVSFSWSMLSTNHLFGQFFLCRLVS